jgi:hypothetical protein
MSYDRNAAVLYAHRWALLRNASYYNYEKLGGDCTNFISQCLFAGGCLMDYARERGWYYKSANDKAPAWTGARFFGEYFLRTRRAAEVPLSGVLPGDVIQLSFDGLTFTHSLLAVETGDAPEEGNILIAAHSYDSDYRPLNTYEYNKNRALHIL